jgi:EmrB/QacA subfamily drug resistance transporter
MLARSPGYRWLVVGTVCVGAFLGQLDASIAGLVLPTLERVFNAPVALVEWVAISYLLTLAALVVPFGRLADLTGRKSLYTAGFLVFIVGSALCGLAPDLGWLVAARVLQAVGAAMLQANSVAIITAAVPRSELGRAIGVQGAAQAVGLSVGPSVGGLLIEHLGWEWVFFIALPFGLVGTLLGWVVLPQTAHAPDQAQNPRGFDWAGTFLSSASIALALLVLTVGGTWGWGDVRTLGLSFLAALLLGGFLVVERASVSPLVDLRLFASRLFSTGIAAALLSYAVLFGSLFLLPFYLERVLGHSPAETGLLLSPIPVALGILAPIAGVLTDRVGPRPPTVVGMGFAAVALAILGLVSHPPLPVVLGLLVVLGVGLGLFTPANNSAVMVSAPASHLGVAGGVLNMTRSLGTSLGVALSGAVLAAILGAMLGTRVLDTLSVPTPALDAALHQTLLFLAGLAILAAGIAALRPGWATDAAPRDNVAAQLSALE